MQQGCRSFVDPLQVIEGDDGGPFRAHDAQQIDDRIEQLRLVGGPAFNARKLRKQRGEIGEIVLATLARERPQEIDPDAVGAAQLGLVRAAVECPSAERRHALAQPGQQPALADAGLALDQ